MVREVLLEKQNHRQRNVRVKEIRVLGMGSLGSLEDTGAQEDRSAESNLTGLGDRHSMRTSRYCGMFRGHVNVFLVSGSL